MPASSHDSLLTEVDSLLQKVAALSDPAARDLVSGTVRALMELHGQALTKIIETLDAPVLDKITADEMVSGLLLLYGLHPHDLPTRVQAALQSVRPYLQSHGGNVRLLNISADGAVRLELQGSCHGCPSSSATLKSSIETAIYQNAPDVTAILVESDDAKSESPADGFVPLASLVNSSAHRQQLSGALQGALP